jgi:cbb3-type cytochrome oxidase subunit 3
MNTKGKEITQRLLAIIVIIAMLGVMGLPFSVIVFFAAVTYFIWRAVQRSEHDETRRIFEFYISANDILRDEEKRWYGFEIASVIEQGERVVHSMIDPPPLTFFALGALYHQAGDHENAIEHLSFLVENDLGDERHRYNPSSELRRYVQILRRIERDPAEAPQTMAAIRSLDRVRRNRAAELLEQSRVRLEARAVQHQGQTAITNAKHVEERLLPHGEQESPSAIPHRTLSATPPPPIADVLRDVYEEKKTA